MNTASVLEVAEKVAAPVALSDEFCKKFGAYDNSGIIFDSGKQITGALFALDLTAEAALKAKAEGCNLIFTHHPAIYSGIKHLSAAEGPTKALTYCIQNGLSVISMHLNFDAAPLGIDHYLMEGLGGSLPLTVMYKLEGGAYGRVYDIQGLTFEKFCARASERFSSARCRFYGNGGRTVSRVASFCGAGCDEESIDFTIKNKADVFVSADMKHHHIQALLGAGINVVEMTHYCSEFYGFSRIYASLKAALGFNCFLHREDMML